MSLRLDLKMSIAGRIVGSGDLAKPALDVAIEKAIALASGVGANQADIFWSDERTLGASGSETLDLAGVLADAFGATIAAAEVVAIFVFADAGNTNNVVIGNATNPIPLFAGTTPTHAVKPGGWAAFCAPNAAGLLTVGAGATDELKVANSGGTTAVTYQIVVIARTA
jgi:hypothetical protein